MIYKGRVWGSPSHTRNAVMEQGEQSQQQQPQEFCVPEQALAVHSLLPQDHQLEGGKEMEDLFKHVGHMQDAGMFAQACTKIKVALRGVGSRTMGVFEHKMCMKLAS